MADPWTHALNLDRAVEQGQLGRERIAQEDYEGAKPLVRQFWLGKLSNDLRRAMRVQDEAFVPARILLGYLQGYFLYREVSENDQAFWPNFLKDLGITDRRLPTQLEYDRLWEVLEWHDETRGCLSWHEGTTRDFIGTLDAIFHFKALRLNALKDSFVAFYQMGELAPEARPYERVFHGLRQAIDLVLAEEELDLSSEEAVLGVLEASGIYLGEPNPIRLLFNRSSQALADLCQRLKGKKPSRPSARFRHKQVRVKLLEPSRGVEIEPTLSRRPLLEGWRVYGKVTLSDGRFKRFSWVPRLSPDGAPYPEDLEVSFDEGEVVRFRLDHQAFALRCSKPVWVFGEPLVG